LLLVVAFFHAYVFALGPKFLVRCTMRLDPLAYFRLPRQTKARHKTLQLLIHPGSRQILSVRQLATLAPAFRQKIQRVW
jgi:hypothetical protein